MGGWKGLRFDDGGKQACLMMGSGGDRTNGVWHADYGDWMWRCDHERNFAVYADLRVAGALRGAATDDVLRLGAARVDVSGALVALGYKAPDADKAARRAQSILGPNATSEALVKKALNQS